jgi:hypothetical protein
MSADDNGADEMRRSLEEQMMALEEQERLRLEMKINMEKERLILMDEQEKQAQMISKEEMMRKK